MKKIITLALFLAVVAGISGGALSFVNDITAPIISEAAIAMAKAGEKLGLDYETAATLAKATCRGSALLSELSDKSLEDLRIAVCSPGGTTIQGVRALEANGFRSAAMEAVLAAYEKTLKLGK